MVAKTNTLLQEAAYFLLGEQSDFSPVAVGFGVVAELLSNHDRAAEANIL